MIKPMSKITAPVLPGHDRWLPRRSVLGGLLGLVAAPAIVRATNIMPVRTMIWRPRTPSFGALECFAARYTDDEAWVYDINVLHPNQWRQLEAWEVYGKAGVMSEAKFNKAFGTLPPLPKGAFQS